MLIPYKLKYQKIYRIQSFVNHIVLDILCKPQIATAFTSSLVLPKYKNLVDDVNAEYILNPISQAFLICKNQLNRNQLKLLKRAVLHNNRIRELCNGEIQPVLYEDIELFNKTLSTHLQTFCTNLYKESIKKEAFYSIFGKIEDYYKKLVGRSLSCRFCGIGDVLGAFHSKRSALDHYFPKSLYPFSSINFRNLVPICDRCNSKYKNEQNPIRTPKGKNGNKKVKAFYPFRRDTPDVKISLSFKKKYSNTITPEDIDVKLSCIGFEDQIETWERLFGIKENYAAFCCSDDMYIFHEEQYTALINLGITHDQYISTLNKNKYTDKNIIKIPFLEAINSIPIS